MQRFETGILLLKRELERQVFEGERGKTDAQKAAEQRVYQQFMCDVRALDELVPPDPFATLYRIEPLPLLRFMIW